MVTEEYATGRLVDVMGDPDLGIVLLWHGRGIDHRTSMHPVAHGLVSAGLLALPVDWNSEAADGGRADLLGSLRFARDLAGRHGLDPDSVVIAGWSLGGTAAVSVAVHAKRLGIALDGCVVVAPGDGARVTDPISGAVLPATFPPGAGQCRIDLVYGERDPLATPDLVAGLELRLRSTGWETSLHAVDADHSEVVGTRYDERTERYLPSQSPAALASIQMLVDVVVAATSS